MAETHDGFVIPTPKDRRDAVWAAMTEIGDMLERFGARRMGRTWRIESDYHSVIISIWPELTDEELTEIRDRYAIGSPLPLVIRSESAKDYVRIT